MTIVPLPRLPSRALPTTATQPGALLPSRVDYAGGPHAGFEWVTP